MAERKEKVQIAFPEGRVINCHLFQKDAFKDPETGKEGTPRYRIEMAYDPDDVTGEGNRVEDALIDAAIDEWGEDIENDYLDAMEGKASDFRPVFLQGDKLAKKRERRGKEGDAYRGLLIVRADTTFNKHGEDGPGGIEVFDEAVEPLDAMSKSDDGGPAIYPGCYGFMVGTIHNYTDNDGNPAQKIYLEAFQKSKDGDKLITKTSSAGMFKPLGKKKSTGGTRGRAKRK